ncbi:MAG: FxsA family protein [Planctomycetota bacterium]|nr:FxsA family protein [Planctomycetota bacterium]
MGCSPFVYAALLALLDLWLLVEIGRHWGVLPALGIAFLPSMLGGGLAQRQRQRVWSRVQDDLRAGRPLETNALEGLVALAAGVLLLIPGPLSTVLGLLLLIPGMRRLAAGLIRKRLGPRPAKGAVLDPRAAPDAGAGWPGGYVKIVRIGGAPPGPAAGGIKEAEGRSLDDDDAPPALPPRQE